MKWSRLNALILSLENNNLILPKSFSVFYKYQLKLKRPPTIEAAGIFSEKKKKASKEAIIGSPSGTAATAVGGRYFNEYVNKLCPRIEGNIASAKPNNMLFIKNKRVCTEKTCEPYC